MAQKNRINSTKIVLFCTKLHPHSIDNASKNLNETMLTLLIISRLCGIKPSQLKEIMMKQFLFKQEKLILTISLILFMVVGGAA